MKNLLKSVQSSAVVLVFGASALSAQSCVAVDHSGAASGLALRASGEASAAVADSTASAARAVSRVIAVPVWISGASMAASGAIVGASADSLTATGDSLAKGGDHLWDFSSGDPAKRPTMDREKAVPPASSPSSRTKDPSPADALKGGI